MPFDRDAMKQKAADLAANGIFIGTSSWKYPGWRGMLYDDARYVWRGKFAKARFEENCLNEYAEVFKTVCVDGAYYRFPTAKQLEALSAQVPDDFKFAFKVTDSITLKRFTNLPRFGKNAGGANPYFLDAELFQRAFLEPCWAIRSQVGLLMFEFSRFYPSDFEHGRDFVAALDAFLGKLPRDWSYGVEMRNSNWLKPEYFACLARHGVTHVYNSWTEMPPVEEQIALDGSETNPELTAARFLLKPGRNYEAAVKAFKPYMQIKEVNDAARQAATNLIKNRQNKKTGKTFIYVNNRLEGNALETIDAMVEAAAL